MDIQEAINLAVSCGTAYIPIGIAFGVCDLILYYLFAWAFPKRHKGV